MMSFDAIPISVTVSPAAPDVVVPLAARGFVKVLGFWATPTAPSTDWSYANVYAVDSIAGREPVFLHLVDIPPTGNEPQKKEYTIGKPADFEPNNPLVAPASLKISLKPGETSPTSLTLWVFLETNR